MLGKNKSQGFPSLKNFFLDRNATVTNQMYAMIYKHVGRSVVIFGSIWKYSFKKFRRRIGLIYFNLFSFKFFHFNGVKCLIHIGAVCLSCKEKHFKIAGDTHVPDTRHRGLDLRNSLSNFDL